MNFGGTKIQSMAIVKCVSFDFKYLCWLFIHSPPRRHQAHPDSFLTELTGWWQAEATFQPTVKQSGKQAAAWP